MYLWVSPIIFENDMGDIVSLGSEKVLTKIDPNGYVYLLLQCRILYMILG